jgi:hypothetical protein
VTLLSPALPLLGAPRPTAGLLGSIAIELVAVACLLVGVRAMDARRRRRAPDGTLFLAGAAIAYDSLARQGGIRDEELRGPVRRPVQTHSGTIVLTTLELTWRPDSYSRRHGGRRVAIPLARVRWAEATPRVFGLGSLLVVGCDDATQIRFITRSRPDRLRRALRRAGLMVSR